MLAAETGSGADQSEYLGPDVAPGSSLSADMDVNAGGRMNRQTISNVKAYLLACDMMSSRFEVRVEHTVSDSRNSKNLPAGSASLTRAGYSLEPGSRRMRSGAILDLSDFPYK